MNSKCHNLHPTLLRVLRSRPKVNNKFLKEVKLKQEGILLIVIEDSYSFTMSF